MRVFTRPKMIQQDAHFHPPFVGAFQRIKNDLCIVVETKSEILNVNIALRLTDLLCDTCEIRRIVRKKFNGIPCEGRETSQMCIEPDKSFIANRNRRL